MRVFSFFPSGLKCVAAVDAGTLRAFRPHGGRVVQSKQSEIFVSARAPVTHAKLSPKSVSRHNFLSSARGSEAEPHRSALQRNGVLLEK